MREILKLDDWELVAGEGRVEEAFAVLFERHKDFVFRVAVGFTGDRHMAEDVRQEVFLRLHARRGKWKRRAGFKTLLYRITANTAKELRRKQKEAPLSSGEEKLEQTEDLDNGQGDDREQRIHRLEEILRSLPRKQREVVALRFFEGLSVAETAAIMRCREGTVKSHLHWAMRSLRRRYGDGQGG